jgi:DNA primase
MPGLIPPHKQEEIRAASDIVEVIRGYLPLRKAGGSFVALCPFHREKTPSFHVNPTRQTFHCFGCHQGGDVFEFVQQYERLTFIEALRRLAERAHIPLEFEDAGPAREERNLRDRLRDIHEQLTRQWQAILRSDPSGQAGRDYLAERGVSEDAVVKFRLGYAPPGWNDTVEWARQKGIDAGLMEKAGLILRRDRGEGWYGRFRGRLMFPIADPQGRVIGFSGRVIGSDDNTAKYVNSPETPLFTKGRVIYGLDRARRAMLDAGTAVICEGQLDTIACHLAGIENAVAPQGTALTADQCRILGRHVEEVVLCFDSDPAGQKAAVRSVDDLLASGLAVRVATVPAPHDPDSFIKENGPEAFRALIDGARGFFEFLLGYFCDTHDTRSDRGRGAVVRGMAEFVSKTHNPVMADTVIRRTAERLGLNPEAIRREFRQHARSWSAPRTVADEEADAIAAAGEAGDEELPRPSGPELWLLRILLGGDDLVPWAEEHLDPQWIQHPLVREVVERRLEAAAQETWNDVPSLLDALENPAARRLVTEAVAQEKEIPDRVRQLMDIVAGLEQRGVEAEMRETRRALDEADPQDWDLIRSLQERSLALKQRKEALRQQRVGRG